MNRTIATRPRLFLVTAAPLALVFVMVLCFATAGCRTSTRVLDRGTQPIVAEGTVSGSVSGPEGTSPIVGRTVTAIEINTGQTHTVQTSVTGGYSLKLPPGDYRFEVELKPGESIVRRPDDTHLIRGDVDSQRDFVIGAGQVKPPLLP